MFTLIGWPLFFLAATLVMLPLYFAWYFAGNACERLGRWTGRKWVEHRFRRILEGKGSRHHSAQFLTLSAFLFAIGLLFTDPALAAINDNNLIEQIINQFRNNVNQWAGPITAAATWMFWMLAILEFTWTGMLLAIKGADAAEIVSEVVIRVMFIGFFAALLAFGPAWAQAIIWSLADIAGNASQAAGASGTTTASGIFDIGLELASRMVDSISFWDGAGDALGLIIGSFIVIVCFALITAMLILTMVETYIVVNAAIILLGFGPTRWTKDYAIRYLVYAGATGMKWFIMLLIVGLGEALMLQWLNQYENNDTQVLLVIGASVVMLALVWNLPNTTQALLTGVSIGMGESLLTAARQTMNKTAMAGSAMTKTAVAAAGAGRSIAAAAQLAGAQGRTGMGKISGTLGNLASAAKSELTDHAARGRYAGPSSGMGHRMSDNMRQKVAALQSNSIQKG